MNRRGRLAKVSASFSSQPPAVKPFDARSASDDELLAWCAGVAEFAEILRICFDEQPESELDTDSWPDWTQPGQKSNVWRYAFNHPSIGDRAVAAHQEFRAKLLGDEEWCKANNVER